MEGFVDALRDRLESRELIDKWIVAHDSGDWTKFRAIWHGDGWMVATWFQGPASEFISRAEPTWARRGGGSGGHSHFGSVVDVADDRAVSQTKMSIATRTSVDGALCDIACFGRFYDFWERRDTRWGRVLRQPIYERDRIDPVYRSQSLELDEDLLNRFPSVIATSPMPRRAPVRQLPMGCPDCAVPKLTSSTSVESRGWLVERLSASRRSPVGRDPR